MTERILSVFIDESGDFGSYDSHAPFYLVAMVLHNQDINIAKGERMDNNVIICDLQAKKENEHQSVSYKFTR